MSEEVDALFKELATPLIKFLNDYGHPHMTIIITPNSAEQVEGLRAFETDKYIKD